MLGSAAPTVLIPFREQFVELSCHPWIGHAAKDERPLRQSVIQRKISERYNHAKVRPTAAGCIAL